MKAFVTGSGGHLGEGLVRTLKALSHEVVGLDIVKSPFTTHTGLIGDRALLRHCLQGVQAVFHTATLHKPHIATHSRQEFVDTNVVGTLVLLEEAVLADVEAFIFTSTTSVFGDALAPRAGAPAAWVTEDLTPIPKNIYGVTKAAAEDLCQLFHRDYGVACLVLRVSRFFPEQDDDPDMQAAYAEENLKANEYLFRRVDLEDAVSAHLLASRHAPAIGFGRYIISATTPFSPAELAELRADAPAVVRRHFPHYEAEYERRGWKMFPSIGRVYVNQRARRELGWEPQYDFEYVINRLRLGDSLRSRLAQVVGSKGYHRVISDGLYAEPKAPA